jgi:hypothetical protein
MKSELNLVANDRKANTSVGKAVENDTSVWTDLSLLFGRGLTQAAKEMAPTSHHHSISRDTSAFQIFREQLSPRFCNGVLVRVADDAS